MKELKAMEELAESEKRKAGKELWTLFIVFLKIGLFTFGGGPAMLPAIKQEVVRVHGWLSEEEMMDCIAICQSLPGMFAVNSCIYVGNKVKGFWGGLAAAFAMTFPAFLSIVLILQFLGKIEDSPYVQGAFEGIKAASVALILVTVWNMGKSILKSRFSLFVALSAFVLIAVFSVNAVFAILAGGFLGYVHYKIAVYRQKEEDRGPEARG